MSRFQQILSFLYLGSSILLLNSCAQEDDPCDNIQCVNDGVCIDGNCNCPENYRGFNCGLFDDSRIQTLLDEGNTPMEVVELGASVESLYGKIYEDGLIFYLDTINGTGMVAAKFDQGNKDGEAIWGCFDINIPNLNEIPWNEGNPEGIGAEIGDGASNTDAILAASCAGDDIAASLCRDLGPAWFLPSIKELLLMRKNLYNKGYGSFTYGWYWSSTEFKADEDNDYFDYPFAWQGSFHGMYLWWGNRNNSRSVRAAKSF